MAASDATVTVDLLRYVYADALESAFISAQKKECKGCRRGFLSHTDHTCVDPEKNFPEFLKLYREAADTVNDIHLKAVLLEACNILRLKPQVINREESIAEFRTWLEENDFRSVEWEINIAGRRCILAVAVAHERLDGCLSRSSTTP